MPLRIGWWSVFRMATIRQRSLSTLASGFVINRGELVNCRADEAGRPNLRRITVLAVADETYRQKFSDWKDRIAEIVATVSNRYETAVSLRLELMDCQAWNYEAPSRGQMMTTATSLLAVDPGNAELLIGWIDAVPAVQSGRRTTMDSIGHRRSVATSTLLTMRGDRYSVQPWS